MSSSDATLEQYRNIESHSYGSKCKDDTKANELTLGPLKVGVLKFEIGS